MPAFFCKKLAFFYPKNWLTLFIQTAPNWPKIRKMTMTSQFFDLTSTLNSFDVALFLVNFSYASKFHVNIITASGIMTIFFYKGLTRNPEIGNTPVWVLPNIWRLGRVMYTKFGTNVCNRMLINAVKFQCYSFYRFWVIKGKPTGVGKIIPRPRRLGLNYFPSLFVWISLFLVWKSL